MDLNDLTDQELNQSILAETAKALNEVRQAQSDLDKVQSRLKFIVLLTNILKERQD